VTLPKRDTGRGHRHTSCPSQERYCACNGFDGFLLSAPDVGARTGDYRLSEIRTKTAIGVGLAALAATTALAAAWAVHAGTLPDWAGPSGIRGADANPDEADRPYPLRLALPPSAPVAKPFAVEETLPSDAFDLADAAVEGKESEDLPEARAQGGPARTAAAKPLPARIPPGFDIRNFGTGGAAEGGELVRTTKPVILGGNALGAIELAVGQGASVSVDRRALTALLADRAPALTAALEREKSDRVTLDTLRTRDVAIRYDPLRDALVIDTRS
jgi:hypothetical protein